VKYVEGNDGVWYDANTLFGLVEVYGRPGDVDGNDDTGSSPPADVNGTAGPAGSGLGSTEVWNCRIIQVSTGDASLIVVSPFFA
jgi:hypothetical protein